MPEIANPFGIVVPDISQPPTLDDISNAMQYRQAVQMSCRHLNADQIGIPAKKATSGAEYLVADVCQAVREAERNVPEGAVTLEAIQQIIENSLEPLKKDMAEMKADIDISKNNTKAVKRDVLAIKKDIKALKGSLCKANAIAAKAHNLAAGTSREHNYLPLPAFRSDKEVYPDDAGLPLLHSVDALEELEARTVRRYLNFYGLGSNGVSDQQRLMILCEHIGCAANFGA